jgi:hypothetical protein
MASSPRAAAAALSPRAAASSPRAGEGGGATSLSATARARGLGLPVDPALREIFEKRAELQARKLELLARQKAVADDLHAIMAEPKDGLLFHTERTRRNLVAAIVVARQMGYFKYYRAPEESVRAEKYVPSRVEAIRAIQADIDAVDAELAALARAARGVQERAPPAPGSLVAWFQANGRPDGHMGPQYQMTLTKSTRRLGATKHYPAFESVASKLTLGMGLRQLNHKRR